MGDLRIVLGLVIVCLAPFARGEELWEPDFEVSESYDALEKLAELEDEPVDLNRASLSDLLTIPWMTPLLAQEIIARRERVKAFASVDDLSSLPRMTDGLLERLRPYLKPMGARPREKRFYPMNLLLRSRLQDARPVSEGYLGDSKKVNNRLRVEFGERVFLGLLSEKDSYETSYCDFLAGYIQLQELGPLSQLVLGNYQLDFGEGLIFSRPVLITKSPDLVKGSERGLEPYTSTDENYFLFGGAFRMEVSRFDLIPFYSRARLDAALDEDGRVRNLYQSGYHRNQTELEKVNRLKEEVLGARVALRRSDWLKIGLTGSRSRYSPAFSSEEDEYYSFSGTCYSLVGADFDLLLGGVEVFGEHGRSLGLGSGTVLGWVISLPPIDLSLLMRDYEDDFYSPRSGGFSDAEDENERGAFGAIGYRLSKSSKVRGYVDLFEHPRPAHQARFPRQGREIFGEVEHEPVKDLVLRVRYRSKGKEESTDIENGSRLLLHSREGYQFQVDWEESKKLSLRLRTELSKARVPDLAKEEGGGMLLLGLVLRPVANLRLEGRLVHFKTDSYDSRIYEYENDLPGVMRNEALYGRGRRFYFLAQERLAHFGKVSLKWGMTSKEAEPTETEYGLQFDLAL